MYGYRQLNLEVNTSKAPAMLGQRSYNSTERNDSKSRLCIIKTPENASKNNAGTPPTAPSPATAPSLFLWVVDSHAIRDQSLPSAF
jgi:hypothetical protein